MGWIFPFVAITAVCIALIVWRICAAVEDWKDGRKKSVYALLEKEREKLQSEYEEKERVLCCAKEQELSDIEKERKRLENKVRALELRECALEEYYKEKNKESDAVVKRYNEAYQNVYRDVLRALSSPLRLEPAREEEFVNEFFTDKGSRAVNEKMGFSNFNVSCKIYSNKSGKTYDTSLTSCTCRDCENNINKNSDYICKHMLAFAIRLNAFKVDPFVMTERQALCAEREKEFILRAKKAENELKKLEDRIKLLRNNEEF